MFHIPARLLEGRAGIAELRKSLTAKHYDPETGITTPVPLYRMTPSGISVPRQYGMLKFPDLWRIAVNHTTKLTERDPLPIRIKPRDEGQQSFVNQIIERFEANVNVCNIQAIAPTGSGKTASSCMVGAKLGVKSMLVLVNTNRLKEGWLGNDAEKKGLRFFYGDDWVARNVGIVQQGVCNFTDKRIVIAMAPSLCSRQYPAAFYRQFELIVIDEADAMAAPTLSQVLGMFPAALRLGVTATPKEGEMAKITTAHLGRQSIISTQEVLRPTVYRVVFEAQVNYKNFDGEPLEDRRVLISRLAANSARQTLLASIIYRHGYERGRNCVILSDRTDQLLDLKDRLIAYGIDEQEIGMYVGAHKTGKKKLVGKVWHVNRITGKTTIKHMRALPGFDTKRRAELHVVAAAEELAKAVGVKREAINVEFNISNEEYKPDKAEYDRIEQECPILLVTYGIFARGIDIKRLDWGMEASPRGDVAQPVGRVLRLMDGKPEPEWINVFDKLTMPIQRVIFGKVIHRLYTFQTPIKLEKLRITSYGKQSAKLSRMDARGYISAAQANA